MCTIPRPTAPWRSAMLAGLLAVAATGVACSDDSLTSPTSPAQLEGTWRLQQMTTSAGVHVEDLSANRFNAVFGSGTVAVKADCNVCNGTAVLSGATLTVSALACTRAACASAPTDTRYAAFFDGPLTVRISNRLLQLNSDRGELRLEK